MGETRAKMKQAVMPARDKEELNDHERCLLGLFRSTTDEVVKAEIIVMAEKKTVEAEKRSLERRILKLREEHKGEKILPIELVSATLRLTDVNRRFEQLKEYNV